MKVTQEKLPDSQIGLEIEISAENTKQTYEKVVQKLARSSKIPGFRQGKVPRHILLQRLGVERIKAAALEELVQKSLEDAIAQESIKPLGNYQLRSDFNELLSKYKPGEPLIFSAACDVSPTVEPPDYHSLSVKAEEVVFDQNKVNDWLESKRHEKSILVPVEDRPAQMKDVVIIDYQAYEQTTEGELGEIIADVTAKDFEMELSEEKFIPGFVAGIVGMNLDENKSVAVTFPEDYPQKELAGKSVVFSITLKEIKEKELPKLDDEFAQDVSEFETMDQLRESLENQFKKSAERSTKNNIQTAILEQLLERTQLELPETMIQEEVNTLLSQTAVQMQNYGMDIKKLFTAENIPEMRKRTRPEAINNLNTSLILKEIAERESIEVSPEELDAKLAELKAKLSDQDINEERLRGILSEDLLLEKTLDFLQEKATVELVPEGSLTKSEDESSSQEDSATVAAVAEISEETSATTIEE